MKAADILIKALENEGVTQIFAVPGEENLDVIEAIRTSSIELIINRHEQGAGFMAATYGRLTGRVGVCLSTLGPGATNLVTAAAYAQLGGMPMMMITGQKPIREGGHGEFQIVNVVAMMRPLTKFTKQIVEGNTISVLVRNAFRIALEERPGAVHLELPEDIAQEGCKDSTLYDVTDVKLAHAHAASIQQAADMLKAAKSPLILIGASANRKQTSNALESLIDKTGIPFFNTQMGKGVVDERHPLFLGTAALSTGDYLHCAIRKADLIINIGHAIVEKAPFMMEHGKTKVVHVDYYSAHVDSVYFPQLEVIGDIATTITHLTQCIEKSKNWDFSYYMQVKSQLEAHISSAAQDTRFPILPQNVVCNLRKALPSDAIIALDNGMYKIWFARNYKAYAPNTVLLDNALATMGAGLSSAMATKLVHPQKVVVAVCGDGGFMMNSHELELAVRLKLDLIVMILCDNGYGMIKWKQANMHFPSFGLDFGNPNFVKLAESYGAIGHCVTSNPELAKVLAHCIKTPGVHLIEVPVDYSQNVKALGDDLKQRMCDL